MCSPKHKKLYIFKKSGRNCWEISQLLLPDFSSIFINLCIRDYGFESFWFFGVQVGNLYIRSYGFESFWFFGVQVGNLYIRGYGFESFWFFCVQVGNLYIRDCTYEIYIVDLSINTTKNQPRWRVES